MPIRWRITLWYSSILSILLLVLGTFIYLFFAQREASLFDNKLAQTSKEVIRSITTQDSFLFPFEQKFVLPNIDIFSAPNVYLQVIDTNGRIIDRSESLTNHSLPISREILLKVIRGESGLETVKIGNTKIRIYTTPVIAKKQIIGLLQVGGTLEHIERSLANLRWILFIGFFITILLVGGAAWFLAKRVLRPIDDIVKATSEIERGQDLKRRIAYSGPSDEIGKLIEQSNHMFARLEKVYEELDESYQMQKRFVSDASHELRTPLTSIKGNIDFLKKAHQEHPELIEEVLGDVSNEIDRMTRLINSLLSLARADAGYQMKFEEIQLLPFFEAIIPQLEMLNHSVPLKVNHLGELVNLSLQGNEDYLRQIFVIIVENACKYSEAGEVSISFNRIVDANRKVTDIQISISDQGIGIPEEEIPNIFKRFYRAENTQGIKGTGLGLPIAKWIVEQHKGTVEVESKVGEGTTFIITLPVSQNS